MAVAGSDAGHACGTPHNCCAAASDLRAVTELAMLLRASESKVSRQAAALRDSGLLLGRKQGTWLLLRLAPSAAGDVHPRM